jgi:hypothetical protein
MEEMFAGCISLIDFSGYNWNPSPHTSLISMFVGCDNFNESWITNWNLSEEKKLQLSADIDF